MARHRPVTDTEAWCNKGAHMVAHEGFAKNQLTCRECRKVYNSCNYNRGLTCEDCGKPVANHSRTMTCRKCRASRLRAGAKVTRFTTAQGYALLTGYWDHPNRNNRGHILEHVKVMSDMLGRPLEKGENVHHKNGVRDDNRPENLELWVVMQPSGQRATDLVEWAHQILKRYAA